MRILLLIALLSSFGYAQTAECTASFKDFPAIRGFTLGMPEKRAVAAKAVLDRNLPADLERVGLYFSEGRLLMASFTYDKSFVWNTVNELAEKVSESLPLPVNAWKYTGRDWASMRCKDFTVSVSILNSTHLSLLALSDASGSSTVNYDLNSRFRP